MKIYNIAYSASAALMMVVTAGCSGSDDWTPGPEDTECGVSAYFPIPAKTSYVFDSEADPDGFTIEVAVSRKNTAEAISIPLSFASEVEGCSIPETVNFEAGEATSSFTLNCSGIPNGKTLDVTVNLDPAQTDIYGTGMNAVTFSVIKAQWILIADNLSYNFEYIYPRIVSNMYHLEGTNQFKLENFFGSGLDIIFNCPEKEVTAFIPLNNAIVVDELAKDWELYDEENVLYPEWYPGGDTSNPMVTYLEVFGIGDSYSYTYGDMYYDDATGYGYIYMCFYLETDDGNWTYCYPYMDFNLKYNPFE